MCPRILIVDDDDANRLTLAALLEDAGFTVGEARSLREGASILSQRELDVVVLDRTLGDGCGLDLIPVARSKAAPPWIVVLSGAVEPGAPGADLCFSKGDDVDLLVERIRALVSSRG